MKREEDCIVFESQEEQTEFEEACHAKEGADQYCAIAARENIDLDKSVLVSIGKAARELQLQWDKIKKEFELTDDFDLAYDWRDKGKIRIIKRQPFAGGRFAGKFRLPKGM